MKFLLLASTLLAAPTAFYAKPDEGTGTGGDGEPSDPPPPPQSVEDKLNQARADLETTKSLLASSASELETLRSEVATQTALLDSAISEGTQLRSDLETTKASLAQINSEHEIVKKDRDSKATLLNHLERLCKVKGIDSSKAVPAIGGAHSASDSGESLYQQWSALKKTDTAKAQAFYRENKGALDAYAATQSAPV